ncbi:MAG: ComEC/Rec2 family competence protein [Planctomycetaceae bacterium]
MSEAQMADSSEISEAKPAPRAPAMTIVLAVAAGLCISRAWPGQFVYWWLIAISAGGLWCWLVWRRHPRASALALLIGWGALAAAREDYSGSVVQLNDISRLASDEGLSIRLEGKVLEPAWIVAPEANQPAPAWQPPERTLTNLNCQRLLTNEGPIPISGAVRMSLTGHYPELTCGDVIQVVGRLRTPAEPLNPGDFDFRSWLKNQGIRAILQVESAECIQELRRESWPVDVWGRFRQALRLRARNLFLSSLSEETAGVAETLLLGGRRRLDAELRQAFVDSGMLHVLAISGMNVALLGVWLIVLARLAGCTSRQSLLTSTIGLVFYAAITDGDPPVVRATVMAVLGAFALWSGRQAGMVQIVGVALLGMMLFHPSDLFDAGAQLSFLSVLTISRTLSAWQAHERARAAGDPPLILPSRYPQWLLSAGTAWRDSTVVSAAIWLATAPLVAWRFQMVSLAGLVLNVVLAPLIVVIMWTGYSFLMIGMIVPVLATPFAVLFDWCLMALIRSVTWASSMRFSHVDLASPPDWWIAGYYLAWGALLRWSWSMVRHQRLLGGLAVCWC